MKNKKNVLYVLFGPYGAGKSYWANKLSKKLKAKIFDIDNYYVKNGSNYNDGFDSWIQMFQDIHKEELKGNNVIVDSAHLQKNFRSIYCSWFRHFDGYVLVEVTNTLQNCIENNNKRERNIPKYKVIQKYKEVEHIGLDELRYFDALYKIDNSKENSTLERINKE